MGARGRRERYSAAKISASVRGKGACASMSEGSSEKSRGNRVCMGRDNVSALLSGGWIAGVLYPTLRKSAKDGAPGYLSPTQAKRRLEWGTHIPG